MQNDKHSPHQFYINRRTFVAGSVGASFIAGLSIPAHAAVTHRRKSLQGANVTRDLRTYAEAVKAMLNEKPESPRNWYRNALTHVMDCPHGNWWFLVWHRGYLGYFEQMCRDLTGVSDFALPYWDWTKETKVPDAFWDGFLNPSAPEYISSLSDFDGKFRAVIEAQWISFSAPQLAQQMTRGAAIHPALRYNDFESFWESVHLHFGAGLSGRNGSKATPDLNVTATGAVEESKIIDALAPNFFTKGINVPGFESGIVGNHHQGAMQAPVEQGPHNSVHGSVGGAMDAWMSPTDPIFFMHHANIDRLWDVWARKQLSNGLSDGPEANDVAAYEAEEFLYFRDKKGDPVTATKASNYISTAAFDYDYEAGTGESVVSTLVASGTVMSDTVAVDESFDIASPATASVALGGPVEQRLERAQDERFFIDVSIQAPDSVRDLEFLVFIGAEGETLNEAQNGPNYAGAITFFGWFPHGHGPSNHRLGVTDTIRRLRANGTLGVNDKLQVAVVPHRREGSVALAGNSKGSLLSAALGSF